MIVSVQPCVGAQSLFLCSHMWGLSVCFCAVTCEGLVFVSVQPRVGAQCLFLCSHM